MSVRLSLLLLRDRISQALHRPRYLHADRAIAKFRKDVRHAIAGGERRLDLDVSALQELDPEADDYVHLHLVLAVIALEVADHDGLRLRVLGVPRLLVDILASWHNIGDVAKNLAALKGRVALAETSVPFREGRHVIRLEGLAPMRGPMIPRRRAPTRTASGHWEGLAVG